MSRRDAVAIALAVLLLQPRARQFRHGAERRLRRVQAEPEILVVEIRVDVGRLMSMRIPTAADMHAGASIAPPIPIAPSIGTTMKFAT